MERCVKEARRRIGPSVFLLQSNGITMIELLNRLIEKHGSRLRVETCNALSLRFKLGLFKEYAFYIQKGQFKAVEVDSYGNWQETANSKWLLAVAQGETRDNAGKVA